MTGPMADFDSSYRTPRTRPGMDPNTRKLAIIAGGLGAALVVMVGAWSFTGGRSHGGGVPVVEADSRPMRVKPEKSQQGPDMDEPAAGKQALAPTPEAPNPNALKAQAEAAALAKAQADAKALAEAKAIADARAQAEAKPVTSEKVALTAPTAPAPSAQPPAAAPAVLPAPAAAIHGTPAKPAATATAPAAKPATGATQVQLAALASQEAAMAEWSRLEKRMPDVFGGRRPAVVKFEKDGKTLWRLRTGGFSDASQASSFCEKVRAKGGNCMVTGNS